MECSQKIHLDLLLKVNKDFHVVADVSLMFSATVGEDGPQQGE